MIIFIFLLSAPSWAAAEVWSTLFPEHKKRIFEIIRKGEKISEWVNADGRLMIFIDFQGEFYGCQIFPRGSIKGSAMDITCYDVNHKE